jgi:hypothetical protein
MPTPQILPSDRRNNPPLSTTLDDGWRKYGGNQIAVYASGTTFTVAGDHTADFTRGRKLRIYHDTSTVYKKVTVISSSFGSPNTTVTVAGDTLLNENYSSIWVDLSPVGYSGELPSTTAPAAGDIIYAGVDTMFKSLAKPAAPGILVNDQTGIPQWVVTGWMPLNATLTYSSADDPTIVVTSSVDCSTWISVGNKMRWVNGGNTIYSIVTAISGTTITCLQEIAPTSASASGGTAARVATANSAITLPVFSYHRSPFGFPMDQRKWTVEMVDTSQRAQNTPTNGTWYNLGSLSLTIPIGAWLTEYQVATDSLGSVTLENSMLVTLSVANNSESDTHFTSKQYVYYSSPAAGTTEHSQSFYRCKQLNLSTKTPYYLNAKTSVASSSAIRFDGAVVPTVIRSRCLYL